MLGGLNGALVSDAVTSPGYANSGAILSPDGSRAAIVTSDLDPTLERYVSWVTVIDLADGSRVGETVAFDSQSTSVRFTPDGTRLVVSTQNYDGTQVTTGTTILRVANPGLGGPGGNGGQGGGAGLIDV